MSDVGLDQFDENDMISFLKDLKVSLEIEAYQDKEIAYQDKEIAYHEEEFDPYDKFSGDCSDAYYRGIEDGRAEIAQDLLRKVSIALNFHSA